LFLDFSSLLRINANGRIAGDNIAHHGLGGGANNFVQVIGAYIAMDFGNPIRIQAIAHRNIQIHPLPIGSESGEGIVGFDAALFTSAGHVVGLGAHIVKGGELQHRNQQMDPLAAGSHFHSREAVEDDGFVAGLDNQQTTGQEGQQRQKQAQQRQKARSLAVKTKWSRASHAHGQGLRDPRAFLS
jgi:hypothetical protein